MVPGHNDDEHNIRASANFIRSHLQGKVLQVQLLPYRSVGVENYASMGKRCLMAMHTPVELEQRDLTLPRLAEIVASNGLSAVVDEGHAP